MQIYVRCPFRHQQRDGGKSTDNGGAASNYDSMRAGRPSSDGRGHGERALELHGVRYDTRGADDHYNRAGNPFGLLSTEVRRNLVNNIAGSLGQSDDAVPD